MAEKIADEARDDTPQALDAVWEEEQGLNSLLTKAAVIQQSLLISVALPVPSRRNI
ncbi:respiratory nitrate reductase 1 subunit delta [Escherichia coli]|uniref:Respiratory nitrate reductase 1 subunit delta n=1 Tax=Escherichia coli TaxID=562 RepID=A0A376TGG4_ECOLX|nr:respiratory nitrate reductase 1 subunit delta [Escherichia coli]